MTPPRSDRDRHVSGIHRLFPREPGCDPRTASPHSRPPRGHDERPLIPGDWPEVESIYAAGIATGNATFEAAPPSWEQFIDGKLRTGRLVAGDDDDVVGWAATAPTSAREVYRGVVEHSRCVANASGS